MLFNYKVIKGTVMQIEKAENDRLRVSKVS